MSAGKQEVREMYLIEPREYQKLQTECAAAQEDKKTHEGGGGKEQKLLESRAEKLDREMEEILRNRVLTVEEKLRRYLETLRHYLVTSHQLERVLSPSS